MDFTGLSPVHLEGFEKSWDPFALRVWEAVCLETMDPGDDNQEGNPMMVAVIGMALLLQVAFPWFHLPAALGQAWV